MTIIDDYYNSLDPITDPPESGTPAAMVACTTEIEEI